MFADRRSVKIDGLLDDVSIEQELINFSFGGDAEIADVMDFVGVNEQQYVLVYIFNDKT